jgi:hypothetical protein
MPGGNKKITGKDGKPFVKKDPRINRRGRPRNTINIVNVELEKNGYIEATKQDIISCYLRLLNIPVSELKKMVNSPTKPALIIVVGRAIISGRGIDIIERILDRSIGKPSNSLELSGTVKQPIIINFTEIERENETDKEKTED